MRGTVFLNVEQYNQDYTIEVSIQESLEKRILKVKGSKSLVLSESEEFNKVIEDNIFKGCKDVLIVIWDAPLHQYLLEQCSKREDCQVRVVHIGQILSIITDITTLSQSKRKLGIRDEEYTDILKSLYFHLEQVTLTLKYNINLDKVKELLQGDKINKVFNSASLEDKGLGKLYRYTSEVIEARNSSPSTYVYDKEAKERILQMYNFSYESNLYTDGPLYEDYKSI